MARALGEREELGMEREVFYGKVEGSGEVFGYESDAEGFRGCHCAI